MKKHIPNLITCLNATSGMAGVLFAFNGELFPAAVCVLAAMVFDFFDGFAARLLNVRSDMGKELDSLADAVSFGVMPAVLAYCLIRDVALIRSFTSLYVMLPWFENLVAYSPLIIPAFSIYRLAKFNLDARQTHSFIGMPTPANALFWVSLVFCYRFEREFFFDVWGFPALLALCVLVFSLLLVSGFPMFSLKLSSFSWRANFPLYVFLAALLAIALLWGWKALSFTIPLYVLVSVFLSRPEAR